MPSDDRTTGQRFDARQFGVGLYEGFKDFRDWHGLEDQLPEDDPAVGWGARIGYVAGALLRVAVYVALTAAALMAMRGGL